jgi:hypothetical protein
MQKRDTKNDTITQHKSGDKLLCPVKVLASIVKRIRSYRNACSSTTVNAFQLPEEGKSHLFSGTDLLK